jgi:predicted  nucleic acid-binding Zn-ribbon protein
MSRAASLMRLQQIDLEIDARRARLGEIQEAIAQDKGLAEAQQALSEAKGAAAEVQRALRALEAEGQALAQKAAEVESTLYGGRISNPKELKDLQDELASLARRRTTVEDRQLDAMEQAENQEAAEREAQARVLELEAGLHNSRGELADEQARIGAELESLAMEHEGAEASVPQADRATYEGLRKRKRGVAVARLVDGVCGVCGVAPSSSRAQAAGHGDELIFCGNCERILYGG